MYHLFLRSKSREEVLYGQKIYWYPIGTTRKKHLISINIGTSQSYRNANKFWAGGRTISVYKLDSENICFFYWGSQGDPLIAEEFGEKPVVVKNEGLNYYFSDEEIEEICKNNDSYDKTKDNNDNYKVKFCTEIFNEALSNNWNLEFKRLDDLCEYGTEYVCPNPILQLIYFTDSNAFSEIYYKQVLEFLLKRGFLVYWIDPEELDDLNSVLIECRRISKDKIKGTRELRNCINEAVQDLFNKYEIFRACYLASQCGSENSLFKILIENLHSLLPAKEKQYVEKGFYFFQPKLIVNSVELHFIQTTGSKAQAINLYRDLLGITDKVNYYHVLQFKANIEHLTAKSLETYPFKNRYRFICKINLGSVDYSKLPEQIKETIKAIKTVLIKRNTSVFIKEMWIKSIDFKIFTPPQFEDDIVYSLANNLLIKRYSSKDCVDEEYLTKIIHISLACDYKIFEDSKFDFSFNYITDMQRVYSMLNRRLALKHNFSQFSSNLFKR